MTKHHRPNQVHSVQVTSPTQADSSDSITVTTAMISAIAAISSSLITGVAAVMAPANIWQDIKTLPPFSKWESTCPIRVQDVRVETGDRILKAGDSTLISVHIANDKDLMLFVDWSSNLNGNFERLDGLGKTVRYTPNPNASASVEKRMQVDQIYLTIQDEPERKCKLDLSTLVTISHDVGTQTTPVPPSSPLASPAPSALPSIAPAPSPSPTANDQTVPTVPDRRERGRSDNAKHPSKYSTIGMPKSDMRGRILG